MKISYQFKEYNKELNILVKFPPHKRTVLLNDETKLFVSLPETAIIINSEFYDYRGKINAIYFGGMVGDYLFPIHGLSMSLGCGEWYDNNYYIYDKNKRKGIIELAKKIANKFWQSTFYTIDDKFSFVHAPFYCKNTFRSDHNFFENNENKTIIRKIFNSNSFYIKDKISYAIATGNIRKIKFYLEQLETNSLDGALCATYITKYNSYEKSKQITKLILNSNKIKHNDFMNYLIDGLLLDKNENLMEKEKYLLSIFKKYGIPTLSENIINIIVNCNFKLLFNNLLKNDDNLENSLYGLMFYNDYKKAKQYIAKVADKNINHYKITLNNLFEVNKFDEIGWLINNSKFLDSGFILNTTYDINIIKKLLAKIDYDNVSAFNMLNFVCVYNTKIESFNDKIFCQSLFEEIDFDKIKDKDQPKFLEQLVCIVNTFLDKDFYMSRNKFSNYIDLIIKLSPYTRYTRELFIRYLDYSIFNKNYEFAKIILDKSKEFLISDKYIIDTFAPYNNEAKEFILTGSINNK